MDQELLVEDMHRADEIGVPFAVTVDHETLENEHSDHKKQRQLRTD